MKLNSGFWGWLSTESQPKNAELGRFNSFYDKFSDYLNTIYQLNMKLLIFVGILQILKEVLSSVPMHGFSSNFAY